MAAGRMRLNIGDMIDKIVRENAEALPFNQTPGQDGPEKRREYMGGSVIAGDCERAIWYGFRWWQRDSFPSRIRRRFETGHLMEPRVVRRLELAGFEVMEVNPKTGNQFRANMLGGLLSGGVDGFVRHPELMPEWGLLEIKAMVSSKYVMEDDEPIANKTEGQPHKSGGGHGLEGTWWKLKRKGLQAVKRTHYGQMQTYMGLSAQPSPHNEGKMVYEDWGLDVPLTRGLYIAVNTDTDQIYDELVEYDRRWFVAAYRRVKRVAEATTPPDRIKDSPMWPPCSFCDYLDTCHAGKPAHVNCRTCKFAELRMAGTDGNRSDRALWLCTKHRRGCGDYTPCESHEQIETEEMF